MSISGDREVLIDPCLNVGHHHILVEIIEQVVIVPL